MLRDRDTYVAQTQARRQRDTPVANLWPQAAPPISRRTYRDYRERSPYTTPTRESSTAQRRSGRVETVEEDSEEDLPQTPLHRTVRREVERQGGQVVAGLHQGVSALDIRTQNVPLIEDLLRNHEATIAEINAANQNLVAELTSKFQESDAKQNQMAEALVRMDTRFCQQAQGQLSHVQELFGQLRTTTLAQQELQQLRIDSLLAQIQEERGDGARTGDQDAITAAVNALKEAREQDQKEMAEKIKAAMGEVELAQGQWKTAGGKKSKGKQPQVESVRSHTSRSGHASPKPLEPIIIEATPAVEGGNGGQGGNGGGKGRSRHSNPDPSDSSESSDEGRDPKGRSRRQDRQKRRPRTPLTHPEATYRNDGPKQAKIPFNGDPKQDVRHWIDQMETLIELQPKVQWSDKVKILWASLELAGSAASFWKNYKERLSVEPKLGTWERFKKELLIQYGNRTSQEQAKQKMDKLRQTGPIDDYLNEMQNLEWDANVGSTVMKSMILTGINSSLETRLSAAIEEPEYFPDWLAWVRRVGRKDADVKARHEILRGRDAPKAPQKPTSHTPRRSRDNVSVKRQEDRSEKPKGDLGATQTQKDKWLAEKKCLRCGAKSHFAKDCHSTSIVRATTQHQANRKRGRSPSGEKDQEEGSKRKKVGTQTQAFRSRITNLED